MIVRAVRWVIQNLFPGRRIRKKEITVVLDDVYDEPDVKPLKVRIRGGSYGISIYVEGYGSDVMKVGHGSVIHMENCGGKFRADLFQDIASDEPTESVYFEGAREELRTPYEES